jgi:hypothetical protein
LAFVHGADGVGWIAVTLVRLGNPDPSYFQFLAGFAREAIQDLSPFFVKFDAAGHPVQGQIDPAFETWCVSNGKAARAVAAVQAGTYPVDVQYLAEAQDLRGDDLLRKGLASLNSLVLPWIVQGLGRLQDTAALPLIERSLSALPQDAKIAAASQLAWYPQAEAHRLMERLIPKQSLIEYWRRQIATQQEFELQMTLKRRGKAAPK